MTKGYEYESEIDALMRKMRDDPRIEAERQRNWEHWWQPDQARARARDAASIDEELGAAHNERDMAYATRRADPQGGRT